MIVLSELDRHRFGHVTAKVTLGEQDNPARVLDECRSLGARFVIARCSTLRMTQVQQLESLGFFLTDTLVWYRKDQIEVAPVQVPEGYVVRAATPDDAPLVEATAARSFRNYLSHYHADPRLDRAQCDAVYSSWAVSSCQSGAGAHTILVLTAQGDVAAFAVLKKLDEGDFDGVLFAVHPEHQGRGLHGRLVDLSMNWGAREGFSRMVYSTQLANVAAQRALCHRAFEPFASCHTLHAWLT